MSLKVNKIRRTNPFVVSNLNLEDFVRLKKITNFADGNKPHNANELNIEN